MRSSVFARSRSIRDSMGFSGSALRVTIPLGLMLQEELR